MPTENLENIDIRGADITLATRMVPVPSNTGTDTGIPKGSGKLVILENITVTNTSDSSCEYILTYENSWSTGHRLFTVLVSPRESVVLAKKTQPVIGSNKTFFHKASAPSSLVAVYSYREFG